MAALDKDAPRIPEFYAGRSIFITGFTGFMGKLLVEKLIWSCPDIKHIYLLLRDKRGLSAQGRLQKILNSDLFERVKEHRKEHITKLVPVIGDVTLPELGISADVRAKMCEEVSIIFHCAASVRFDDPLTRAIDISVRGTKSVIDLALDMPKLIAYMHVSTAYSNCDRFDIQEKIYPPHADWDKTLKIRNNVDPGTFCILSEKYMNHMPNTYVFSKSLGEHIAIDHSDRIPVAIFRPSIVVSTVNEPFAGWIDNFNGPVGLLLGYSSGAVRTSLNDKNIQPDFIPCDVAIKGLVIAAYARKYKKEEGVHFYNWCTRDRSITYEEMINMGKGIMTESPMKTMIWKPTTHTTDSKFLYYTYFILFQLIPAFFVDIALRIVGRKPLLVKIQRKVYLAINALSYFTLNYFHFENKNGYDLANYIPEKDLADFYYLFKKEEVNEYEFFLNSNRYVQVKFFKMKPKDFEFAKIYLKVLIVVDAVVKTGFGLFLSWLIYKFSVLPSLYNSTIEFLLNF